LKQTGFGVKNSQKTGFGFRKSLVATLSKTEAFFVLMIHFLNGLSFVKIMPVSDILEGFKRKSNICISTPPG